MERKYSKKYFLAIRNIVSDADAKKIKGKEDFNQIQFYLKNCLIIDDTIKTEAEEIAATSGIATWATVIV